jgi:hypothetical protein
LCGTAGRFRNPTAVFKRIHAEGIQPTAKIIITAGRWIATQQKRTMVRFCRCWFRGVDCNPAKAQDLALCVALPGVDRNPSKAQTIALLPWRYPCGQ